MHLRVVILSRFQEKQLLFNVNHLYQYIDKKSFKFIILLKLYKLNLKINVVAQSSVKSNY